MAIDQTSARSRRAILAAGLGGLVATVASALGRPPAVRAGSDGDVVLGDLNSTTGSTQILATTPGDALFVNNSSTGVGIAGNSASSAGVYATSDSSYGLWGISQQSYGVYGQSSSTAAIYGDSISHPGVVGHSDNTIGVSGVSPNGNGVVGSSGVGTGVVGTSNATDRAGVSGSTGGDATGVLGYSGSSVPATAPAKTGVYGEAAQDASAKGVWGKTTTGHGVQGTATSGTALYGSTAGLKKGLALRTIGRVRFDSSVGIATIASGTKSVTVTPGINLVTTSAVVATLQGNPGGSMTVQRVEVDAAADTFTIYLTANAATTVTVAWHVFG